LKEEEDFQNKKDIGWRTLKEAVCKFASFAPGKNIRKDLKIIFVSVI
jgi:hypothetical protein